MCPSDITYQTIVIVIVFYTESTVGLYEDSNLTKDWLRPLLHDKFFF